MTWPSLPRYSEWADTCETLHRWMQIAGKVKLALTPLVNHWWNVPLDVTARGLTTSGIPCGGERWFDMEFDLVSHVLRIRTSDGGAREIPLAPVSVAAMYRHVFDVLRALGIECAIWPVPVEIENPIPLDRDEEHHAYDRDAAERFRRAVALSHDVLMKFRGEFIGKCSPVQFFWGSFDLAVTRFSGRPAPARPDADAITREAYSHEVSSAGFWPGDSRLDVPSFFSYAAPEPAGFRDAPVRPAASYYNEKLFGFYLPYDEVRRSSNPEQTLLDFCHTTYDAAARLGNWDRDALERRR